MTTQDMTDLLIIHDAAEAISEAISSLFGEIGEEGRFGELQKAVFRLISRNAAIYDPEEDIVGRSEIFWISAGIMKNGLGR